MKKKHRNTPTPSSSNDHQHSDDVAPSDFYKRGRQEKPLYDLNPSSGQNTEFTTARHQVGIGRKQDKIDPRERAAMLAILRAVITLVLIVVAFVLLQQGISLYEEKINLNHDLELARRTAPVTVVRQVPTEMMSLRMVDNIKNWKEAERLVRAADGAMVQDVKGGALENCLTALELVPVHKGALKRLGKLYYELGEYEEAVLYYAQLVAADPTQEDLQKKLIEALGAAKDYESVIEVAQWYQTINPYDAVVQGFLAKAYFDGEDYAAAVTAYERVRIDSPNNIYILENLATTYMKLGLFERALEIYPHLRDLDHRNSEYYKQMALCHAQLLRCDDSVQVLGRAAQLFNTQLVVGWIEDPGFNSIRTDHGFHRFVDRIAGLETRLWLEKMAAEQKREQQEGIRLGVPVAQPVFDSELLKPKQ